MEFVMGIWISTLIEIGPSTKVTENMSTCFYWESMVVFCPEAEVRVVVFCHLADLNMPTSFGSIIKARFFCSNQL